MFKTDLIMKIQLKKTLKNVSLMILMLQMCFVFSQKKVIVIDVGHGGKDTGAIGVNGIQENSQNRRFCPKANPEKQFARKDNREMCDSEKREKC